MALSNPGGLSGAIKLLPDFTQQQNQSLADVTKVVLAQDQQALNEAKFGLQQAKLAAGGGTGGPRAGGKGGAWTAVADPVSPEGYRFVWVPGSTEKERSRNQGVMESAAYSSLLQNDRDVREKLAGLSGKSIDYQAKVLDDIRKNDIPRLVGTDDQKALKAIEESLRPYTQRVKEGRKAIDSTGFWETVWDAARMGGNKLVTGISQMGEDAETKRKLNAELQADLENIRRENPYLQEQMLREQEGQGFWQRSDGIGGLVTNAGVELASDPTAPVAMGAAAAASALTGGAAIPAIAAGLAGAGVGAGVEGSEYVSRVEQDPNLSEEEKARAIEEGFAGAATTGAAFGGLTIPVGRIAGAAARPFLRGGAKAAAKTAEDAVVDAALRRSQEGLAKRLAKSIGESAAEASIINVGDVVAQNALYNSVTGQDNAVTEGVPEALAASIAAGVPFGILGARRRRTASSPAKDTTEGRSDAPRATADRTSAASGPEGGVSTPQTPGLGLVMDGTESFLMPDGSVNRFSYPGQLYNAVATAVDGGVKFDADNIVSIFLERTGNDHALLKDWIDRAHQQNPKIFDEKRVGELFDAAMRQDTQRQVFRPDERPTTEFDTDKLVSFLRKHPGEPALYKQLLTDVVGNGVSPEKLRDALSNAKIKSATKVESVGILDEIIEARQQELSNGRQGGDGQGGNGAPAPRLDANGEGRARAAYLPDNQGNRGMEANTRSVAQTPADAGAPVTPRNGGTVESGGLGGAAQQNIGPSQAPDADAPQARLDTGTGTDGGPSPATAGTRVQEPGAGAGVFGGQRSGSERGTGGTGGTGRSEQVSPRASELADMAVTLTRIKNAVDMDAANGVNGFNASTWPAIKKLIQKGVPSGTEWDAFTKVHPELANLRGSFERMHNDYLDARALGVDAVLDAVPEAEKNTRETIESVYNNIWCVTR